MWQAIETLPDVCGHEPPCGEGWHPPVLVYVPDRFGGVILVAQRDAGMWLFRDDTRACDELTTEPTHWMPLPDPPKSDSA